MLEMGACRETEASGQKETARADPEAASHQRGVCAGHRPGIYPCFMILTESQQQPPPPSRGWACITLCKEQSVALRQHVE